MSGFKGINSMRRENIDITYQTEIMTAVRNNSELVFITYSDVEDTEEKIKFALAKILEKYKRDEILTPVRSCIKELIANATKANAKMILISEGKIKDPENQAEVVRQVQGILNEGPQQQFYHRGNKQRPPLGERAQKNLRKNRGLIAIRQHCGILS